MLTMRVRHSTQTATARACSPRVARRRASLRRRSRPVRLACVSPLCPSPISETPAHRSSPAPQINVPIPVPLPMFSWSGNKGSVLGGASLYGCVAALQILRLARLVEGITTDTTRGSRRTDRAASTSGRSSRCVALPTAFARRDDEVTLTVSRVFSTDDHVLLEFAGCAQRKGNDGHADAQLKTHTREFPPLLCRTCPVSLSLSPQRACASVPHRPLAKRETSGQSEV